MSYYNFKRKYVLTHHAIRRARERLNLKNVNDHVIYDILEEYIEYSINTGISDPNTIVFKNLENNITFVFDKNMKIIKTIY